MYPLAADVEKSNWVDEIISAFRVLGGAARYDDLYEYIALTTTRDLTKQWKATVRRTIEDHSSDSKNFRSVDHFRHVEVGFWGLRDAGDLTSLVRSRRNMKPRAIVDEAIKRASTVSEPRQVLVREHWRNWPKRRRIENAYLDLDKTRLSVVDGWITDQSVVVKLAGGLIFTLPLVWYPSLISANRIERSQIEIGDFGIFWPLLNFELVITDILNSVGFGFPLNKDDE